MLLYLFIFLDFGREKSVTLSNYSSEQVLKEVQNLAQVED